MSPRNGWTIEVAERDLGIPGDSLIFGRDASHSFLRLKDDNDRVVGELHGRAYDPKREVYGTMRLKLSSVFNQGIKGLGNFLEKHIGLDTTEEQNAFDRYASKRENKLKVEIRSGADIKITDADSASPLVSGPKEKVLDLWERAIGKARIINAADLEYRPIEMSEPAQNCHSVLMDLAETITGHRVTPRDRVDQTFAMPGWATHLNLDKAFAVAANETRRPVLEGVFRGPVPV